ncbi:MAG: ABC transporter permease [Chitinivibrionales bacterium]|nr:ABC transporter permease [Chitinivibrionales bacterium]
MRTIDINLLNMAWIYGMFLAPVIILHRLGLKTTRRMLIGIARMTVQLALVGIYLRFIFTWNNPYINLGWVLIMIIVANVHILKAASVRITTYFAASLLALVVGMSFTGAVFIALVIRPQPVYEARYLVPIAGMILGNCQRVNIISFERFYAGIQDNTKVWQTMLSLGATRFEAARPFMQQAIKAALNPTITTMATMGIVSLPGMMTGQMLGGSFPMVAIKYQIAIMICILTSASLTSVINMFFCLKLGLDAFGNVRA